MSYEYRKDNRTDEEFKTDIKRSTKIEQKAAKQFFEHFVVPKHPDAVLEDYGCDNSGKVIKDVVTQASDNIIKCSKWTRKYEMKVSPARCVTLKDDQIPKWLQEKEYVLWVTNFGKKNVKFYEMTAATSLKVFQEHGTYAAHPGFGGKKGWRLYEDQLDNLQEKYKYKVYTL